MTASQQLTAKPTQSQDSRLEEINDELTRRLETGEPVDVDALAAEHPAYADELRRIFPAINIFAPAVVYPGGAID